MILQRVITGVKRMVIKIECDKTKINGFNEQQA